jgi:hypothetical protein
MEAFVRDLVRDRAGLRCEYCRAPQEFSELRFHIEHIVPRQHGGDNSVENLALACPDCNLHKGPNLTGIDPNSGTIVRLFHPRREGWTEHFGYVGFRIVGQTAIGRTTAALLKMNDVDRLRVREALRRLDA